MKMNNPTDQKREQPKGGRITIAIAFAAGLGAGIGAAISQWITRILAH